jgi:RNA polymerase sigma-70 factor (ECF subfamily)
LDRRTRFELEALPYWRPLYGAAYRMTRSVEDAQDLVQDTFVRAYAAFDRFQPGTNLRAWLFTILHRARTDRLRRRARRPVETELSDDVGTAPTQDRLASGYEELERALLALPEAYRAAVVLRDVEDLSYREIAEVLDVAVGTVMSRIHRGRALLRTALAGRKP